uniref:Kinesin-like protein n=1 Tax=Marsilea vestita TaxID=59764 RepID=A0A142KW85_MARVE|nr:armadillo repeat-containing kinesin a [Marsilea vestita]
MSLSPYRGSTIQGGSVRPRLDRPLSMGSATKQTAVQAVTAHALTRSKSVTPSNRRPNYGPRNGKDESGVSGRVRVAVRLRPRNTDEILADADFGDYVELMPELKRLRLRKNNWDSETFQFDEVLTETASQKRVYEVVAKPVVESVLEGYNGTVMAYGQTGTGKTYTLGKLGEEDTAGRGIMVRAMEDILADTTSEQDSVTVSYLQLYMETVQDLLAPEKDNISIVEDPKTGDVSLPGATLVEIKDQKSFVELLEIGEANRFAANTKLNTESSRSHAILLVNVKKMAKLKPERELSSLNENGSNIQLSKNHRIPTIRKSKLLIVDLAGSERVDKSGSEGHTLEEAKYINLSLTALGKCINALAENSPHVPIRDSKLTRLLRDSFGGSARTSLIITIGPSPQHRGETTSTILFGQRAMKVENMVKLKEEFDYKGLCRRLEMDLDRLIAENERQNQAVLDAEEEMEQKIQEAQKSVMEAEKKLATTLEEITAEKLRLQKEHMETIYKLEQEKAVREKLEKELKEHTQSVHAQKEKQMQNERAKYQRELEDRKLKHQQEIAELTQRLEVELTQREALEKKMQELEHLVKQKGRNESGDHEQILLLNAKMQKESDLKEKAEKEVKDLKNKMSLAAKDAKEENSKMRDEMKSIKHDLEEHLKQKKKLENEIKNLKHQLLNISYEADETRKSIDKEPTRTSIGSSTSPPVPPPVASVSKPVNNAVCESLNGQRATIAKLFEQVGLQKILSLLDSEDMDVRVHAVKVVANLAAEEANQEKIVEAGGLGSLLSLLQSSEDETIRRVAAGAIANLAMNEINQELIMAQGGILLLAKTANEAEDPQTLRMVAGAIANLCGNDKLQGKLREEGGIKALLGMVRSRHQDVLAQIARGLANFAKCESRGIVQAGQKKGRSLLIDDGALPWIVSNASSEASPIRRHIELALCHLAQHDVNAKDLIAAGALWELVRISKECSRDDIRTLAKRTLSGSSVFQSELRKMHLTHE